MSTVSNPGGSPPSGPLARPRLRLGGKSIWDWLNLLAIFLIPLVVAVAPIGFGWWQGQLADVQQQETILKTYLDDMSDLMLKQYLSTSKPGEVVREVARERTLTTLRRLDADRNRIVLRFLQDAHLISMQDAVIDLSNTNLSTVALNGANLSGIDLSGADLSGADLSGAFLGWADLGGATLSRADLNGATLSGANLSRADLSGADLSGADLSGANLSGVHLSGVHLNGSYLNGATLNDIDLSGIDLNGAHLSGAHLNGSYLNGAFLRGADLSGADLSGAHLDGAFLRRADLSDADLSGAHNLTQQQFDTVYSCTNAKNLSTGLTCHHSGSTVTLTYWYTESPVEQPVILRHLIPQFEQQNPNIKINPVYKPFLQTQAAFITAAQAGNAPDVLRSNVAWVTQFASQGYLLNIDSYVSQSHLDLSDYLSVPLSYDKYNGGLYGLPQVTDFLALLYNKAELAKVGITSPSALATMADFEAAAKGIVQRKAAPYGFETAGTSYVLPFLYAFGGGMFDQHNKILVNHAESVAGLNFLLQLQNRDKVMPQNVDFSTGPSKMVDDFKSGKTAMIFDGPYEVSNILTGSAFTGKTRNLGIAGIPKGDMTTIRQFLGQKGRAGQTGSLLGGQSYVIYAHTALPDAAYKFISFMSLTDSQVAIAKANHTLPTRQSANRDPGVSGDPVISAFLAPNIQKTAIALPPIPQGGHLFDAFDPNIGAALDGAKMPPDALNAVAYAWKQLLASS